MTMMSRLQYYSYKLEIRGEEEKIEPGFSFNGTYRRAAPPPYAFRSVVAVAFPRRTHALLPSLSLLSLSLRALVS